MAGKANDVANATKSIECKFLKIRVKPNSDGTIRYHVQLDVMIDAMRKNYETEEYEIQQVDYIDFVPSVLKAQVLNLVEGLDFSYSKKQEASLLKDNGATFGAAEFAYTLRNAKIVIERTKFVPGDEYTDRNGKTVVHEHTGYNTNIVSIKVTDKIQDMIDSAMDNIF